MAGRRAFTHLEEVSLLRTIRQLPARDRLLVTLQWQTGFRISEILRLTVGAVTREEAVVDMISVAPRHLKGRRGPTRRVPVLPESRRALESHLGRLRRRYQLTADLPLFLSRKSNPDGTARAVSREGARRIMLAAFAAAGIHDDGRLGTHSLRKTFAQSVLKASGNSLLILKQSLGHRHVATSERYVTAAEDEVLAAIRKTDFTRRPRRRETTTEQLTLPAFDLAATAA